MDFIIFPPETPVYILIERLEDYYRSKAYTSK